MRHATATPADSGDSCRISGYLPPLIYHFTDLPCRATCFRSSYPAGSVLFILSTTAWVRSVTRFRLPGVLWLYLPTGPAFSANVVALSQFCTLHRGLLRSAASLLRRSYNAQPPPFVARFRARLPPLPYFPAHSPSLVAEPSVLISGYRALRVSAFYALWIQFGITHCVPFNTACAQHAGLPRSAITSRRYL